MFLNYINNFRGIAILFILMGHCMDAFAWHHNELTYDILKFFIKNGTVLFVFISGFLFQHLSHKYQVRTYLLTKAKNVILPYIIVSLPAIIYFTCICHREDMPDDFYDHSIIAQILLFYITGRHITAFWFIPMISLYYFISPILLRLDKTRFFYYLLPIFIAVSVFVPRTGNVLINFIHFFSIYVFGMFFSRYKTIISDIANRYVLWTLLFYFILFLLNIYDFYFDWEGDYLNFMSKITLCVLIISLLYKYENRIRDKGKYLASVSFGLYFIHSYVIQALRYFLSGQWGGLISPNGSVFLLVLFCTTVIAISVLLIEIIKKIFGKSSRQIIGC